MTCPTVEEACEVQGFDSGDGNGFTFEKNEALEVEIRTLQGLSPSIAEDIDSIFKEAVTDSIWSILPEREARTLLMLVGEKGFECPRDVYATLDSILHSGSQILKSAIQEEFRANVHLLMEKMETGPAESPRPAARSPFR